MAGKARPKGQKRMLPWLYDLVLWSMGVLIDLFFREVVPRGAWKVPKAGPIILVAAPHANQFVDSLVLMRVLKNEAKRRISFLIAEKSTKRKFIGSLSTAIGSIPVARALDKVKKAEGKIFLPDQDNDPCLIRGVGTKFKSTDFQVGGLIVLPTVRGQTPSTEIGEILSDEELRLRKPFKSREALDSLTGSGQCHSGDAAAAERNGLSEVRGTRFKVAPYVDQTKVYDEVFNELNSGGCIGIFPEGGSHDRTDLLPLKAGVAIMALGAMANNPDCGVQIIPIGMNYFHAHKFRSRAVIEFGHPIEVHPDQVEAYKRGDRRNAVGSLLETVYQGLVAVTQSSPDYDTLMLVQAARRLYNPTGKKLPLPLVVELNRRLVKGYTQHKDDPRIVEVKSAVHEYNRRLKALRVKDHQLEWGNPVKRPWWLILGTLFYRLGELLLLFAATLPGLALFWPVFVTTKVISLKKSREALAASTVKLQGRDVIATWKLLVAMAFAPALYAYYTGIVSVWLLYNRRNGYYTQLAPWWARAQTYVPDYVPIWFFALCFLGLCITITMAALKIGEIGMDVLKSLPPLIVALDPRSSNSLVKLRQQREALSVQVTEVINALGPEVFPDFDADRIVADPFRDGAYQSRYKRMPDSFKVTEATEPSTPTSTTFEEPLSPSESKSFGLLPRNESFRDIGGFGFFATRPHTPRTHSRASSSGGGMNSGSLPIKAFSTLDSQAGFDEVTKKIRGEMRKRGRQRESVGETGTESSWDMASRGDSDNDDSKKEK